MPHLGLLYFFENHLCLSKLLAELTHEIWLTDHHDLIQKKIKKNIDYIRNHTHVMNDNRWKDPDIDWKDEDWYRDEEYEEYEEYEDNENYYEIDKYEIDTSNYNTFGVSLGKLVYNLKTGQIEMITRQRGHITTTLCTSERAIVFNLYKQLLHVLRQKAAKIYDQILKKEQIEQMRNLIENGNSLTD